MYRFFVEPSLCHGEIIEVQGDDYNHIKNVLRLKIGEQIAISDGTDREYICSITGYSDHAVLARIEDILGNNSELKTAITLYQGYPKADKLELIIQKAVELGAVRIVPVMMKRSVVKLDKKKAEKRVERLNSIALSAAKQSKRGIIPTVDHIMSFQEAVEDARKLDLVLVPYEDAAGIAHAREVIRSVRDKKSLGIFIGPEGGFEQQEIEAVKAIGAECITLGHRILRTETAGMTMLSILMFELEEDV